jgi:hypothetical protein
MLPHESSQDLRPELHSLSLPLLRFGFTLTYQDARGNLVGLDEPVYTLSILQGELTVNRIRLIFQAHPSGAALRAIINQSETSPQPKTYAVSKGIQGEVKKRK